MKPVRIQFVAPRAWKVIWSLAAVLMIALGGVTGWQAWQHHQTRLGLQAELERWQSELKARSAPVAPANDPREASEKAAQRLLQRDWNLLFDAIENPALAEVRLVQLSFDAHSGLARLEYALTSMAQGVLVASALNGAGDGITWQLERLSAEGSAAPQRGMAMPVRGVWSARVE